MAPRSRQSPATSGEINLRTRELLGQPIGQVRYCFQHQLMEGVNGRSCSRSPTQVASPKTCCCFSKTPMITPGQDAHSMDVPGSPTFYHPKPPLTPCWENTSLFSPSENFFAPESIMQTTAWNSELKKSFDLRKNHYPICFSPTRSSGSPHHPPLGGT